MYIYTSSISPCLGSDKLEKHCSLKLWMPCRAPRQHRRQGYRAYVKVPSQGERPFLPRALVNSWPGVHELSQPSIIVLHFSTCGHPYSIIYSRIRLELLAVCMAEREKEAYKMKMEEQKKNSLRLRILLLSLLSFHIIYQCVKNSSSSSTIHFAVGTTLFSSELIL